MDSLYWQQDAGGLHVRVNIPNGAECLFSIDNSLINYLLAGTPRIYYVYVLMNGTDQEETFILDLARIRPVIQRDNALKLSFRNVSHNSSIVYNGAPVGRYCLARGESYHDRFLSVDGWQSQRLYQDIYDSSASRSVAASQPAAAADVSVPEPPKMETPPPPAPAVDDSFDLDLT